MGVTAPALIHAIETRLRERFDDPYRYRTNFSTEEIDVPDEETGEDVPTTVFHPVQMVRFQSEDGTPYVWYARQSRFDDTCWEIAFGTDKDPSLKTQAFLDLELTGKGQAWRVFATVLEITNEFIAADENYEIRTIWFSSTGDKRSRLYLKHLHRIENFGVDNTSTEGDVTTVHLRRVR